MSLCDISTCKQCGRQVITELEVQANSPFGASQTASAPSGQLSPEVAAAFHELAQGVKELDARVAQFGKWAMSANTDITALMEQVKRLDSSIDLLAGLTPQGIGMGPKLLPPPTTTSPNVGDDPKPFEGDVVS